MRRPSCIFVAMTVRRRRTPRNPWLPESRGHNTWETNTTRPIAVDPGRLSIGSRRPRGIAPTEYPADRGRTGMNYVVYPSPTSTGPGHGCDIAGARVRACARDPSEKGLSVRVTTRRDPYEKINTGGGGGRGRGPRRQTGARGGK